MKCAFCFLVVTFFFWLGCRLENFYKQGEKELILVVRHEYKFLSQGWKLSTTRLTHDSCFLVDTCVILLMKTWTLMLHEIRCVHVAIMAHQNGCIHVAVIAALDIKNRTWLIECVWREEILQICCQFVICMEENSRPIVMTWLLPVSGCV